MADSAPWMQTRVVTDSAGTRDDGFGEGPSDAQLVGGFWMPKEETHFPEIMYGKKRYREREGRVCYQYHKLEAAVGFVSHRRSAIDIGAHVGFWAVWLSKEFEHVMCFEPMEEFHRLLRWNMDTDNYTLFDCALGADMGFVSLKIDPNFTGGTHIVGEGEIHMEALDTFDFQEVDFIKIDVEGYEYQVVAGGEETIKRNRPIMVVEQKGNDAKHYGQKPQAALKLLQSWGMKPIQVISGDYIMGWN